jgi:hypothetical protein
MSQPDAEPRGRHRVAGVKILQTEMRTLRRGRVAGRQRAGAIQTSHSWTRLRMARALQPLAHHVDEE